MRGRLAAREAPTHPGRPAAPALSEFSAGRAAPIAAARRARVHSRPWCVLKNSHTVQASSNQRV